MDIYAQDSYKKTIKLRLKELQSQNRPALNLKTVARQIPIQYTYLSKALNDEKTHLNEDHLYSVCQILDFLPEEMEFLQLQRTHNIASDGEHKKYLYTKIERLKKTKDLNVDIKNFSSSHLFQEMSYLFDPLTILIHVALYIPAIRKDPRLLGPRLGIAINQIKAILKKLDQNEYIELDDDGLTVKKMKEDRVHFGRDHILTRTHQTLLKTVITSQLTRTAEEDKHSFLITFTMDGVGFEKVKDEFQSFLKKVEQITQKSRDENVYQLNFDLFKWI